MIVCVCEGVSDREIREAIDNGSKTLQEIGRSCRAGTDCATCCMTIRQMLNDNRPRERNDEPHR